MRSNWQVFRMPLLLAALSLLGLSAALLGDGLADLVSWLSLGSVVGTVVYQAGFAKGGIGIWRGKRRGRG